MVYNSHYENSDKEYKPPFYQTWMTIVYDQDLNVVNIVNPQYCMLLQLTTDILINSNLNDLDKIVDSQNRKSAEIIISNLKKARDENRNVYFEYITTHKDNTVTYAVCYAEKGPDDLIYVNIIKIDEENIFEARDGFTSYILDSTMNNVSVGVVMRHFLDDNTNKYLLFNDVAKEFYECDNVLQSPHWVQDEDDIADAKAFKLRDPLKIERVIRNSRGDIKRWLVITKKKANSRSQGYYIITTIIDITSRRRNEILLEKQFSLLDSMYRCLPQGIIIYDDRGAVLSVNQKAIDLFGLSKKEDVRGINLFKEPNLPEKYKEALLRGEDVEYEIEYDFDKVRDNYLKTELHGKKIFNVKATIIHDKDNVNTGYLEVYEDITKKRDTEIELSQKHALLETMFDNLPIGIELYDNEKGLVMMNRHELSNLGLDSGDHILGATLKDNPNLSPEIKEKIERGEKISTILEYDFDKTGYLFDESTHHKGVHYFDILAAPVLKENGSVSSYLFVNNDITEKVYHQRLLEKTAAKLSTIFNSVACGIEIYDLNGNLIDCNMYNLALLGVATKEEYLNSGVTMFNDPNFTIENKEELFAGKEVMISTSYDFDKIRESSCYPTSKHGVKQFDIKITPVNTETGELLGFALVYNDVTLHRMREMQFDQLQKRLNISLKAGEISVWEYNINNKEFRSIGGASLPWKEISWEENYNLIHPDEVDLLSSLFNKLLSGEIDKGEIVNRYKYKNEEYRYHESHMISVRDTDGKIIGITGTQKDITDKYLQAEREKRMKDIMEFAVSNSDLVVWEYDVNTDRFIGYNDFLSSYDSNAIIEPKIYLESIHPNDRGDNIIYLERMRKGESFKFEFEARVKMSLNDSWSDCSISGMPFTHSRDGRVDRYVGYRRDNTRWINLNRELESNIREQKRLAENLRERNLQLGMALKAGNIIPIVWDINSDIVYTTSQELKEKYDVFDQSHNGLPINMLLANVYPGDRDKVAAIFDDIRSGRKKNIKEEFRYDIKGRFEDYFEGNFILLDGEGELPRVFGYLQNITERKHLLQELQYAKDKAEQSDRLKSAFLANMSHEIRTPLNAIVGFSELLTVDDDLTGDEKNEYQRIIGTNNDLLLHIVNDILDLSKIEAGVIERNPEWINLSQLATDLYTTMSAKITNSNIKFSIDVPTDDYRFNIDPNRMKQLWMNFITNAIKHTKCGHIRMGYTYKDKEVYIYVEDTGCGIPKELHSRVFGRFQKLDDVAQGTGLGLAICKAIVEAAGGTVGFCSTEGSGSTFWAKIPSDCHKD